MLFGSFLSSCRSVPDTEPTEEECSDWCENNYQTDDQKKEWEKCKGILTDKAVECLTNKSGSNTCPLNQKIVIGTCYYPKTDEPQNATVPSQNPGGSTNSTELKRIAFNVVKIDLYKRTFSNISLPEKYPPRKIDFSNLSNDAPTGAPLSYQEFANILRKNNREILVKSASGNYRAKIDLFMDSWIAGRPDSDEKQAPGMCGEPRVIKSPTALKLNVNKTVIKTYEWDLEWGIPLIANGRAAKAYNDVYSNWTGKGVQVNVYLVATPIEKQTRDEVSGACTSGSLPISEVAKWDQGEAAIEKVLAKDYREMLGERIGEATKTQRSHVFTVFAYLDNIMEGLPYNFEDCKFSSGQPDPSEIVRHLISHEIGHHFLSAGHDPAPNRMLSQQFSCSDDFDFGYTPTEFEEPEDVVLDISETTIHDVREIWLP